MYYLTFLNRKIKYCYLFTYYLLYYYYYILYVIILLYTLLYIEKEQKQTEREGQRLDGLPSYPPRPRPLPLLLVVREGKSKQNRKRENQGEGCRRHLRPFLASLLFCLLSSPSTPSPAAHHFATIAPATRTRGRAATPSGSGRSPLHPAGVLSHICGHFRRGEGGVST